MKVLMLGDNSSLKMYTHKILFAITALLLVSCHNSREKKLETTGEMKSIPYSVARRTWSSQIIKAHGQNEYYIASIYVRDTGESKYPHFCLDVYKKGVDIEELHSLDLTSATGPNGVSVEIIGKDKVVYLPANGYTPHVRIFYPIADSVLNEFKQYLTVHIDDTLPGMFNNLPIKPDTVAYFDK